jgi:hypothetical protein
MTIRIPKRALAVAVGLLLVAGAAAAGYFGGYAAADRDGALEHGKVLGRAAGYAEGKLEGHKSGYAAGHRDAALDYVPGTSAYKRIFNKGRKAGLADGRADGYTAGSADAFAGFDGGWEIGSWYMVHFGQPVGSERYRINWRVPMDTGKSYNVCADDASHICEGPLY